MHRTLSFVLEQSSQGHHHLFDTTTIRRAFARPVPSAPEIDGEVVSRTEGLLDALQREEDLRTQRDAVARAPGVVQDVFVHLYFRYLEGFMQKNGVVYH